MKNSMLLVIISDRPRKAWQGFVPIEQHPSVRKTRTCRSRSTQVRKIDTQPPDRIEAEVQINGGGDGEAEAKNVKNDLNCGKFRPR